MFLLAASTMFAQKVTYDSDRAFDFAKVKTYQWVDTKDSHVNELQDKRLKQAIDENLASKGMRRVDANPDVFVVYQVGLQKETQINTMTTGGWDYGPRVGYAGGMGTTTATTTTIKVGTLVINFVNPADKKLVFRSQGTDTLNPNEDPDKNYKRIQKYVKNILKNFKPVPKG